jgi:hypothetical protein
MAMRLLINNDGLNKHSAHIPDRTGLPLCAAALLPDEWHFYEGPTEHLIICYICQQRHMAAWQEESMLHALKQATH